MRDGKHEFSGNLFDFNRDGKTDSSELALGFMILEQAAKTAEAQASRCISDVLDSLDIDQEDFEAMNSKERSTLLEEFGLDLSDL